MHEGTPGLLERSRGWLRTCLSLFENSIKKKKNEDCGKRPVTKEKGPFQSKSHHGKVRVSQNPGPSAEHFMVARRLPEIEQPWLRLRGAHC